MNRIFSGIQPSGNLQLGNYIGAIRNWARMQKDYECIFCVVDLHAITLPQDPEAMRRATREVAAGVIAGGVDPDECIIFNQSQVPEHAELAWILNCVARIGWVNRMTQFKDKVGKDRDGAFVGLYTYPVLQAADILAYKATDVPVGEDQKQHIELSRDIAQAFNSMFGVDFFPLPEPRIQAEAARIMSLRDGTKKMSKSDPSENSRINMTDGPDDIVQKIRRAKTDPQPLPETVEGLDGRPEATNLSRVGLLPFGVGGSYVIFAIPRCIISSPVKSAFIKLPIRAILKERPYLIESSIAVAVAQPSSNSLVISNPIAA